MTIRTPSWLEAGSYTAEDDRLLLKALRGGSPNHAAMTGLVGATDFLVTASPTPDMFVHVAPGAAFIAGSQNLNEGIIGFISDATVDVQLAASDATNDRISLIVAQVLNSEYSGSQSIGQIVEVAGQPAASPQYPAQPADSILLAVVTVAKGTASIAQAAIADARGYPVTNFTVVSSTAPANPAIGARWITPGGAVSVWNGGAWVDISGDPSWTALTVDQNGWIPVDSSHPCQVRKIGQGMAAMEGAIKNGTLGSTAFTLPAGFWPNHTLSPATMTPGNLTNTPAQLIINSDGTVAPNFGNNQWVQLDCVFSIL